MMKNEIPESALRRKKGEPEMKQKPDPAPGLRGRGYVVTEEGGEKRPIEPAASGTAFAIIEIPPRKKDAARRREQAELDLLRTARAIRRPDEPLEAALQRAREKRPDLMRLAEPVQS